MKKYCWDYENENGFFLEIMGNYCKSISNFIIFYRSTDYILKKYFINNVSDYLLYQRKQK